MRRYVTVSVVSGIVFGILDGLIHANPWARPLYAVYEPIARTTINAPAGIVIDLIYGFVMAAVFIRLRPCLPGDGGLGKGVSYGLLMWFFRVVMQSASHWMMFTVPATTLLYGLCCGLAEMLVLGVLYGLVLAPAPRVNVS